MVILGHGSLTFEDLNQDTGLIVLIGGESLLLLGGDGSVSGDQSGHDTTSSLNTLRKGSNIQKEQLLGGLVTTTSQNGGLDGGTISDGLIGVDGSVGLLSVEALSDELNDLGNSGGTTDQNDVVDGVLGDTGILQDVVDGGDGVLEHGEAELLKFSSGDGAVVILRLEEGVDLNGGLGGRRKNSLGSLTLGSESSHGSGVASHVQTGLLHEVSSAVLDELVIEILTTKMGITTSGLDLEDTVFNGQKGDIESTSSQIEDKDVSLTLTLLVQTVSDSGGGGLVDDSKNVETANGTSILSGLSLGIVEVSGDSDDGILDGLVQESFSSLLHLGQDHRRDLLSVELLLLTFILDADEGLAIGTSLNLEGPELDILLDDLVVELSADKSLSIEDSVDGVSSDLILGGITDQSLGVSETNVRGSGSVTLIVGDNFDSVILPDADARVSGTKIDTNSSGVATDLLLVTHYISLSYIFICLGKCFCC
mmetsp:Transcript_111395/g.156381  ORF Transcript_111395/g.156381 Transcript_111395/m.156381 type:complete len:480 (+) Transcript_111395:731-2170(+)